MFGGKVHLVAQEIVEVLLAHLIGVYHLAAVEFVGAEGVEQFVDGSLELRHGC